MTPDSYDALGVLVSTALAAAAVYLLRGNFQPMADAVMIYAGSY